MLVEPTRRFVEVRSGHRVQLVMRCAPGSGLYVLSEHGICLSVEHHEPGAHTMQLTAPDTFAKLPDGQLSHVALPLRLANVPGKHATGSELPMPVKKPAGVVRH